MKTVILHRQLQEAIEKRNRRIIAEYFAYPPHFRNAKIVPRISKREGISKERVYQIIRREYGANKKR